MNMDGQTQRHIKQTNKPIKAQGRKGHRPRQRHIKQASKSTKKKQKIRMDGQIQRHLKQTNKSIKEQGRKGHKQIQRHIKQTGNSIHNRIDRETSKDRDTSNKQASQ